MLVFILVGKKMKPLGAFCSSALCVISGETTSWLNQETLMFMELANLEG
jgi:hypothetical protein